MAEELHIPEGIDKAGKYKSLLPQIEALISDEPNLIANLANVCAALKETFGFLWVGFYLVENDELVLGPFQGPVACTRIGFGKGVCGTAWKERKTVIVPDVNQFPGHIACSSESQSEIVVPLLYNEDVKMVLDIDSNKRNEFDENDKIHLEKLMNIIEMSLKQGIQ